MKYEIEMMTEKNHPQRGVAFLVSDEDKRFTTKDTFDKLDNTKCDKSLRTRFDYWRDGQPNKKGHHGWNKSEFGGHYTKCYVFKCDQNRFYGFLCHPRKEDAPRYEACIIVKYAKKKEHETDESELKFVEEIRTNFDVQKTVQDFFKVKK